MKLHVRKRYYKRSKEGRRPASYHVIQPKGIGSDVHGVIRLDPILRKNKDLREGILKHEEHEIKAWGRGESACHRFASSKEPQVTRRLGGVKGFWKEIDKRQK